MWHVQLGIAEPIKWHVAPRTMGGRPLLWLTSHQRDKIEEGLMSVYQPAEAFASLNEGADGAVGGAGRPPR